MTQPPIAASPAAPPAHVDRAARFPLFDSLRAIAALAIVTYHVATTETSGTAAHNYLFRLDVGLTLFFVISGFLLYRPYVRARIDGGSAPALRSYAWRRFLRIVPAYWVALTVVALWRGYDNVFSADGLLFYGFGQVYRADTILGGIGPAWTLGVEVSFYAFLPLWALFMTRLPEESRRDRIVNEWVALAALIGASILFKEVWVIDRSGGEFAEHLMWAQKSLLRFIDQFALGMGLAVASVALAGRPLPRRLGWLDRRPGLAWAGAALAYVLVVTQYRADGLGVRLHPHEILGGHILYGVVAFLIVLPAVLGDQTRGAVRRLLASRVLLGIGAVSYALYLWHRPVIDQLVDWGVPQSVSDWSGLPDVIAWLIVVLPPSLAIAALSYYLIELPALSLKRRPVGADARRLAASAWPLGVAGAALLAGAAISGHVKPPLAVVCLGAAAAAAALSLTPPGRRLERLGTRPGRALVALGTTIAALAVLALVTGPPGIGQPALQPTGAPQPSPRPVEHVVSTYDGSALRLYVDGRLRSSRRIAGPPDHARKPIEIGGLFGGGLFDGDIDEVALYTRALPPEEVLRHETLGRSGRRGEYAAAIGSAPTLRGWWRLGGAPNARRAADSSGHATGTYAGGVQLPAPPLVSGADDGAAGFVGAREIVVPGSAAPDLGDSYTLEAWVRARNRDGRHVVGSAGSYDLGIDPLGGWTTGIWVGGRAHYIRVDAGNDAAPSGPGVARPAKPTPDSALLVLFAGLALVVTGLLVSLGEPRRRRRPPTDSSDERPREYAGAR